MATSIIKNQGEIYTDTTESTTYIVPMSALMKRRFYGMAIMGAWKELFAVFFLLTGPSVVRLTNNTGMSCTVEQYENTQNLKFTFGSTVWGGISILPL